MENQIKKIEDTTLWVSTINKSQDKSLSIIEFERSLNFNQVLDKKPLINLINNNEINEMSCIVFIRELLLNTASTLKFAENITLSQATTLASDVFDKMKYDTLDDIGLMFKMARQGEFGSLKGRIDSDVIHSLIIPAYLTKKSQKREESQINNKTTVNKTDEDSLNYNLEMLDKMSRKIIKEQRAKRLQEFHSSEKEVDFFLEQAKRNCKLMSNEELITEIQKAKHYSLNEFVETYENELKNRTL
ncbi:hypothetical protein [Empedobacter brevis]|uniref:hypothetical protein n=1 Tax=Empedobacter brevis TaxID=247 RepID=UPI0033419507